MNYLNNNTLILQCVSFTPGLNKLEVHQKCQICMEILKMRFSILHTFHQISRTFYFWSDLDLAGDLDL